jgi:hypothetical protein
MGNEPTDTWSQRLRELDRIGGLGLSALILFGIYRLVTIQLSAYNGLLDEVASSQRSVADSQLALVQHTEEVADLLRVATENQGKIVAAIRERGRCIPMWHDMDDLHDHPELTGSAED